MNAVLESTVQNMSHFIYFHSYRNILRPKEVLKLYQASLFQCVQTDFNKGRMIDEMGMVVTREGPISVADLLLLSITCLQNLYYAAIYLIPTTLQRLRK